MKQLNVRVALIISVCLVFIDLLGNNAAPSSARWFTWLPLAAMTILLAPACREFQKRAHFSARFGSVVRYGLKISLMVAGFMIAYRLLFLYILFPTTEADIMHQVRNAMDKNGSAPRPALDSLVATTQRWFVPFAILGSFAATMSFGLIASVIGALCSKFRSGNIFSLTKSNEELCKQKP